MKTALERFEEKYAKHPNGCWEWTAGFMGTQKRGCFFYEGAMRSAPRIAYLLYKGEDPGEMCVCHSCDNPKCVNPEHLWLGTQKDNVRDMIRKGRNYSKAGIANPKSKLSDGLVKLIRDDRGTAREVIEKYGLDVCIGTIHAVRSGRNWSEAA